VVASRWRAIQPGRRIGFEAREDGGVAAPRVELHEHLVTGDRAEGKARLPELRIERLQYAGGDEIACLAASGQLQVIGSRPSG